MSDIQDVFEGHEFNCDDVEPAGDYEVLPAGEYNAMIDSAEVVATKAGTGFYLKIQFSILEDGYNNRKIFANINLSNPNQTAVEIGMKQLSALGRATGVMKIKDSSELIGQQLRLKLKVKDDATYGPQNEVKAYLPVDGQAKPRHTEAASPSADAEVPAPKQAVEKQSAPVKTGDSTPPWKK